MVGIDRGAVNTIATSDGHSGHVPGWRPGEQDRFLALQQRLARQTRAAKTSGRDIHTQARNRDKTLASLARLRATLADRRDQWIEATTTKLARDYDLIALERLQTTNMVRRPAPRPDPEQPGRFLANRARAKAALNQAILASRWAEFATRLEHKTLDGQLTYVNPRFTSQQCHACGHISSENRESQAVFACTQCGHTNNADTNAAENILERALQPEDIGGSPASAEKDPPGFSRRRNHQETKQQCAA